MERTKRFSLIILASILVAAFVVAAAVHDSSLFAEVGSDHDQPGTPGQAVSKAQIRQLMDGLSDLFEHAAGKVSAFVVPIYSEQVVEAQTMNQLPEDPFREFFGQDFFRRFFEAPPQKQTVHSLGSGVIVSADGHILTNNHVVAGADKLTVMLSPKQKYDAKVIGTDSLSDVALIKINAANLPFAVLGDSDKVQVGEWVIAVGNPFALLHTVTHGIISAKGRSRVAETTYEDFLQTDAPINPGNSGGALANLDGEVIGINTAIATPSGGNVGIGFAIPINMAKSIMNDILSKGRVIRGYLGIIPQDIDDSLAKALKLPDTNGALVAEVTTGSAAERAGLKVGDVIVEVNGRPVEDAVHLRTITAQTPPGTALKLGVLRDGRKVELTATLAERPIEATAAPKKKAPEAPTTRQLGLTVQTLTPDVARQLGYGEDKGAVVANVATGSAAEEAGLKRGDLIKEVNRTPIQTAQEFEQIIEKVKKGDVVALLVRRGDVTEFVAIKIQ